MTHLKALIGLWLIIAGVILAVPGLLVTCVGQGERWCSMNTPPKLTDEQIEAIYTQGWAAGAVSVETFGQAIESTRDAQWIEMLSKQEPVAWMDPKGINDLLGQEMQWHPAWNRQVGVAPTPLFIHPQLDDTALLRQALEALAEGDTVFYPKTKLAIAALKERLGKTAVF